MTIRLFLRMALVAGALMATPLPAEATVYNLIGQWKNANPATRSITRVTFFRTGDQYLVHVWGKCHPRDCDWGERPAQLFAPSVGASIEDTATHAIVQFDQGAIQTMLILEVAPDSLNYDTFTIFPNEPNRSSYHNAGQLVRE